VDTDAALYFLLSILHQQYPACLDIPMTQVERLLQVHHRVHQPRDNHNVIQVR